MPGALPVLYSRAASARDIKRREKTAYSPRLTAARAGPSIMRAKKRDVYTSRYYRQGNSYAMIIPPDIREAMALQPGDTLALNFQHGVMWVVKIQPSMIANREQVSKIFNELFPGKDIENASE